MRFGAHINLLQASRFWAGRFSGEEFGWKVSAQYETMPNRLNHLTEPDAGNRLGDPYLAAFNASLDPKKTFAVHNLNE